MLNYYQTILSKVSFDKQLFAKELQKALNVLSELEKEYLCVWCYRKFKNQYEDILEAKFRWNLV
jgi:hypothetical protein